MIVSREIRIPAPVTVVFDYLADLSNIFEWDPNASESSRLDLGPLGSGSRFLIDYKIGPIHLNLEYELTELVAPRHLCFNGRGDSVELVDRLDLVPEGLHTRLTYEADLTPKQSVSELFLRPFMERVADQVAKRLHQVFDPPEGEQNPSHRLHPGNLSYRFTSFGWHAARARFTATVPGRPGHIVITGATSGLGRSATFTLASKGCSLILVGRNSAKLEALQSELLSRGFSGKLVTLVCNMENPQEIQDVCHRINSMEDGCTALINNAGALYAEPRTVHGIERTTMVDLVAPYLLAEGLFDSLKRGGGTVVNVVSGGLYGVRLDLAQLRQAKLPFSGPRAYAQAKRALLIMTERLNSRRAADGVRVHAMHPGWADTPGVQKSLPKFHRVTSAVLRTPFQGIDTALWLALTNPASGGHLWLDRAIQPNHLFSWTRETARDRERVEEFLQEFTVG